MFSSISATDATVLYCTASEELTTVGETRRAKGVSTLYHLTRILFDVVEIKNIYGSDVRMDASLLLHLDFGCEGSCFFWGAVATVMGDQPSRIRQRRVWFSPELEESREECCDLRVVIRQRMVPVRSRCRLALATQFENSDLKCGISSWAVTSIVIWSTALNRDIPETVADRLELMSHKSVRHTHALQRWHRGRWF